MYARERRAERAWSCAQVLAVIQNYEALTNEGFGANDLGTSHMGTSHMGTSHMGSSRMGMTSFGSTPIGTPSMGGGMGYPPMGGTPPTGAGIRNAPSPEAPPTRPPEEPDRRRSTRLYHLPPVALQPSMYAQQPVAEDDEDEGIKYVDKLQASGTQRMPTALTSSPHASSTQPASLHAACRLASQRKLGNESWVYRGCTAGDWRSLGICAQGEWRVRGDAVRPVVPPVDEIGRGALRRHRRGH